MDAKRTKLQSLNDPVVRARIREAEQAVLNDEAPDDDLMSVDELESVIDQLRAGRETET